MTKDEALKLALEALESDYTFEWPAMHRPERAEKKRFEAITAIKEALAQPVGQAPCVRHCESTAYEIVIRGLKGDIERLKAAQRTWVGLTNEEKGFCAAPTYVETVARIEAKLKEKNT
jgi:hypothetical protein